MPKTRNNIGGMAVLVLLLGAVWMGGAPLYAQGNLPWVQLSVVDVNPSMIDEFLAVQAELTARARKGGTEWRQVSRTEAFGNPYRFLISTPMANLASLDRRPESAPGSAALMNRLEKCLVATRSYAILRLPELSNPLPEDREPGLMIINLARVSPGREQDYMQVMKDDFFSHFNEEENHYLTGSLAFGGESGFLHLFFVANFAELDQGSPVLRAVGAEGAQRLAARLSGIVTSSEMWIARLLPELSYSPSTEKTRNQ